MAKQLSVSPYTGKLGHTIGYTRGDKFFFRSMPQKVRQTANTRQAAQRFGAASRKGSLIRKAFYDDLDVRTDGSHGNRLTRAIVQAGRNNHAALAGFQFNRHTGLDRFFPLLPTFTKAGKLLFAPQQIFKPKGVNRLEVKLIAARINFTTKAIIGTDAAVLYIDLKKPFNGAEMSVDVPGEGTLLVTLQVRGFKDQYESGDRRNMAADIIAVADHETKEITLKQEHPSEEIHRLRLELLAKSNYSPDCGAFIQRE